MPTPKLRGRLPGAQSLEERAGQQVTGDGDAKHLQMGEVAATTGTKTYDGKPIAGRRLRMGEGDADLDPKAR